MIKYFKAAFKLPWNMLVFIGAMGFAALSGHADIAVPLVLAGEATYLGLLGSHPKFQRYIEAQEAKEARQENSQTSLQTLQHILRTLPRPAIERFDRLRGRCLNLRQIAFDLKEPGSSGEGLPFDSFQLAGLDRLLWIYLRMLFTQHSLGRFLAQTKRTDIADDIADLERRLAELPPVAPPSDITTPVAESLHNQKMRRALDDNLATCRDRLANFDKAQANSELVELELERLENKIQSLAEMAVNRQEPDFISSQVDQVAKSMVDTERTMNDLQFATGLGPVEEDPPPLVIPTAELVH